MTHYILQLLPPHEPLVWCGYEPNPATPGAGCHRWLPGTLGREQAIKFVTYGDAMRSGVGAPNTAYGRTDNVPGRGVKIIAVSTSETGTSDG